MSEPGKRLDGWKSIASFFGRDRTTVARWARERSLPVHHIPGGKQKSVFAYEDELVAWATRNPAVTGEGMDAMPDKDKVTSAPAPVTPPKRIGARGAALLGLGAIAIAAAIGLVVNASGPPPGQTLPPALMADYLVARDAWARRTPEDIKHSIELYEKVIRQAPDYAPARAGLAEAWLIYREYGDVSDARAFGVARVAAQKAISLDPGLPSAHRALGFIDYWWDNDPVAAVKAFRQAISLDDKDAQTQFWFANVLADLGKAQAAEKYYERARMLSPGSQPIAVEHACAQWQAGRDELALNMMTLLKQRYPMDATISNCLAWVHIGRGDIRNFAAEFGTMARIRNEPEILRLSKEIDAALASDPATAHRPLIVDARRQIAAGTRRIREVPAFYASSMSDRAELIMLLREANDLGERWYSPAITSRMNHRWRDDHEITGLLERLHAAIPHIEGI